MGGNKDESWTVKTVKEFSSLSADCLQTIRKENASCPEVDNDQDVQTQIVTSGYLKGFKRSQN